MYELYLNINILLNIMMTFRFLIYEKNNLPTYSIISK